MCQNVIRLLVGWGVGEKRASVQGDTGNERINYNIFISTGFLQFLFQFKLVHMYAVSGLM